MSLQAQRRLFTVAEYHQMAQAGILGEDDRVELIEGEIIAMNPIGSRHAAAVARLTRLLVEGAGGRALVWVQNPVQLDPCSEPRPDVALLRPRPDHYATAHPGPGDTLLIVEVADTSADYDRQVKVPLYARAGVPEVWLVDLDAQTVEIYRRPSPEGFGEREQVGRGGTVAPAGLPGLHLDVDGILG